MRLIPSAIAAAIASISRIAVPFHGGGRKFRLDEVEGPRSGRGTRQPVLFDTGLSDLARSHPFGGLLGVPSPFVWHSYFNDFDSLAEFNGITDTATWDVHAVGVNTFALADGDGGRALITNAAADNDGTFFQKKGESFRYEAGKPMVFGARFQVSDATQSDVLAGLVITDSTPLDATDGIFFLKDDGDTNLDVHVRKDGTSSTVVAGVLANATDISVQLAYDGESRVYYGLNGRTLGSLPVTNAVNDEDITVTFGIQNGEAVAKTMNIDYIFAAKYMGRS